MTSRNEESPIPREIFSVRPARESDINALARIKSPSALHRDRLRDAASGSLQYLVVEAVTDHKFDPALQGRENKALIGFGMVVINWPETWPGLSHQEQLPVMVDLMIQPEFRRKGAGTLLIQKLEAYALSRGCSRLYLSVNPVDNALAQRLYLRLGYRPLQVEPYLDHWEFTDSDGNIHRGEELAVDMVKDLINRKNL